MIFKIKEFYLFIFLLLLQSCSGGRIGNFLESSFDNLENSYNSGEQSKAYKEKKVLDLKKKVNNQKEIQEIKENKIKEEEIFKDVLVNKKVSKLENKIKTTTKNKVKNSQKKRKNNLQSYKIIFILKDVDPKDPIEELSTILRNYEVNFEIEKIERFPNLKNKTYEKKLINSN